MALNIKNEETTRLIAQLAKATGKNMTEAVTDAVRAQLHLVQRNQKRALSERLLRIGKDCATHLKGRGRYVEHGDFLYDDKGLPR